MNLTNSTAQFKKMLDHIERLFGKPDVIDGHFDNKNLKPVKKIATVEDLKKLEHYANEIPHKYFWIDMTYLNGAVGFYYEMVHGPHLRIRVNFPFSPDLYRKVGDILQRAQNEKLQASLEYTIDIKI